MSRVQHRTVVSIDDRGSISDIFYEQPFDSAAIIYSRKGSRRGDHYHRETRQLVFLLEGSMQVLTGKVDTAGRITGNVEVDFMEPGDFVVHEPCEAHTFIALYESIFFALSNGPRGGPGYETDTFRLDFPGLYL